MGKCVVHMQKIKAGAVRGIQSHVNREHESKTNLDIDYSKSNENYSLWRCANWKSLIDYNIRLFAQDTKTVRKDAVVLCSFIITSDEHTMKAMSPEQQKNFFKDAEEFFSIRYGAENIVSAVVHMDENTPHMHLALIPIINNKLCCKEMFTPKELKELQTDFAKVVGKKYGLERGEENSKRKHKSEIDFKLEKQSERLSELTEQVINLEQQADSLQGKIDDLKAIAEQLKTDVDTYDVLFHDYEKTVEKYRKNNLGESNMIVDRYIAYRTQTERKIKALEQKASLIDKLVDLVPEISPLIRQLQQHNNSKKREKQNEIGG